MANPYGIPASHRSLSVVVGRARSSALLYQLLQFAWTAIISFSALPLRLTVFFGFFVAACGVAVGLFSIYAQHFMKATVPGWTSLVCLNIVFSGVTLVAIGLVGEYVAHIYEEAKGRPLYVVSDSANLNAVRPHIVKAVILPPPDNETSYEAATKKAKATGL